MWHQSLTVHPLQSLQCLRLQAATLQVGEHELLTSTIAVLLFQTQLMSCGFRQVMSCHFRQVISCSCRQIACLSVSDLAGGSGRASACCETAGGA